MIPPRGSASRSLELCSHGRWFDPPYWTEPSYLEDAPWPVVLIDEAFQILKEIFPAEQARTTFIQWLEAITNPKQVTSKDWSPVFSTKPLFGILLDLARPELSELLAIGLDARKVNGNPDGLRERLALEDQHHGARFELAIHAALVRAQIPFRPAREKIGPGMPNPDFTLDVGGRPFVLDAKFPRPSDVARQYAKLYWRLLMGPKGDDMFDYSFDLTRQFSDLRRMDQGWRAIEDRVDELAVRMRVTQRELNGHPEGTRAVVDGLITVTVPRGTSPQYPFIPLAEEREPERLIRMLHDHLGQMPQDGIGAFALRLDSCVDLLDMESAIRDWFGESESPGNVAGVVLIQDPGPLAETSTIRPVWRASTPSEITNLAVWRAFANGYNWRGLCVRRKKCEREARE